MVTKENILALLNLRLNRILSIVELVAPADKFPICRKLILDEFGRDNLGKDLDAVFVDYKGQERERTGGSIPRKRDGVL
jgi:hypothetical protein